MRWWRHLIYTECERAFSPLISTISGTNDAMNQTMVLFDNMRELNDWSDDIDAHPNNDTLGALFMTSWQVIFLLLSAKEHLR
mmetsp:Transcript_39423/g.57569  ORF Transcript_39423/g.57569 Transcript_39423/m.57569 type:complete len:82 (+) Transcript_39423:829-1074(+)